MSPTSELFSPFIFREEEMGIPQSEEGNKEPAFINRLEPRGDTD